MRTLSLVLSYKGTHYAGWQWQENALTIQQVVTQTLEKICGEKISLNGCSRTDAGVHAKRHISSFRTSCKIPVDKLPLALNALLPEDIVCLEAKEETEDFHARFDAKGKQYSYYIYVGDLKNPFTFEYAAEAPFARKKSLNLESMRLAGKILEGKHDFKCFQAVGAQTKTTVRTLYAVEVDYVHHPLIEQEKGCEEKTDYLRVRVRGDGFLYNMVRIIAGTLLYVGLGKLNLEQIRTMLEQKDRTLAGKTMQAKGLFLDEVYYEKGEEKNETSIT